MEQYIIELKNKILAENTPTPPGRNNDKATDQVSTCEYDDAAKLMTNHKTCDTYLESCRTFRKHSVSQQIIFESIEETKAFMHMTEDEQKEFLRKHYDSVHKKGEK